MLNETIDQKEPSLESIRHPQTVVSECNWFYEESNTVARFPATTHRRNIKVLGTGLTATAYPLMEMPS